MSDLEEEVESGVSKILASIRAYKGHFTRSEKIIQRLSAFVGQSPSSLVLKDLEDELTRFKALIHKITDNYITLQEINPDDFDDYAGKLDELHERYNSIEDRAFQIINDSVRAPAMNPAIPPQAGGQPGARVKVNDSLKPKPLTRDNTPAEFRSWCRKFRAFYTTSGLDKYTIEEQQAYLNVCLDVSLETKIRDKVDRTTPIFGNRGQDSCIQVLEEEFLLKYPVFTRRLEFFKYVQAKNQAFSDFSTKLREKGDEADLGKLTVDELYVFRYICGCSDSKLQERLLKIEKPTLEDLNKEARAYEIAQQAIKSMDGQNKVCKAEGGHKGDKRKRSKSVTKVSRSFLKGKCYRCGSSDHVKDCPKKDALQCKNCNRAGHSTHVCLSRSTDSQKDKSRQNSRAPSRSSSPQPPAKTSLVRSCRGQSKPTPRFMTIVESSCGKVFECMSTPDTGATRSVIAFNIIKKHGIKYKEEEEPLYNASNDRMKCEGSIVIVVSVTDGPKVTINALVSSDLNDEILISWHDMISLGILHVDFPSLVKSVDVEDSLELITADFTDILDDKLGTKCMTGTPMTIHLQDGVDIVPKRILTARQLPLAYQDEAEKIVAKLVAEDIIVPVSEPTDWISPAHFVPKEGGKGGLRLVTDFTALNRFVKRPVHPFPSSKDIIQFLDPTSTCFAKLDAVQGYFQIPLEESSSFLTTFLLPQGRFRYKRAPMGLNASGDEWCYRSDLALVGLPGVKKLVDDILIQAPNEKILLQRIRSVLERCREHRVTISKRKLEVGRTVKFAGNIISADGIKPDPEKVQAIKDFPVPTDLTSLRSFLGLANQLGFFIPDLAQATKALRQLLQKDVAYIWLEEHQNAFDTVKEMLTSDLLVKPFNPNLPTQLLTDASRLYGLGYALLQHEDDGTPRLIRCNSRSLSATESRYATIELECLAIQWAIEQSYFYLLGLPNFVVVTDHRPLIGIFSKELHQLDNARLQRYREKLVSYTFEVQWNAGKDHLIADALSRHPVFPADETDEVANVKLCQAFDRDPQLQCLFEAAEDPDYKALINALRDGKDPRKLPIGHPAQAYRNVWQHLSLMNGEDPTLVVYDNNRIVIPQSEREAILKLLHLAHTGQVKTKKAAQQLYYWPGINNSIKQMVENCPLCQVYQPSQQKEPLITSTATAPMQEVAADLFETGGQNWLIMVDRFSGYPFANRLNSLSSAKIIETMATWFNDYGWPQRCRTDGGPQFRTEFAEFCTAHNIDYNQTSPYNSQSNGLAEAAVKNVKRLIQKITDGNVSPKEFSALLLEWRNTPRADGFSPAQMFMGRRQRGQLPTLPIALEQIDLVQAQEARTETQKKTKAYFDLNTKQLERLQQGQHVLIQHPVSGRWSQTGEIMTIKSDRTYEIKCDDTGRILTRNRRFIRPWTKECAVTTDDITESTENNSPRRSSRLATKKKVSFTPDTKS